MWHGKRHDMSRPSTLLTAAQLVKAAETVNQHGARKVFAIVTHGILSGKAIDNINQSCLSGLVVTNSASTLFLRRVLELI